MPDMIGETGGPVSPLEYEFLQGLGLVLSHNSLYGASHSVTVGAVGKCYAALLRILETKEGLNISVAEDTLLVDGSNAANMTPAIRSVVERLSSLSIASFTLNRGIVIEEFKNIVELLMASPDEMKLAGGFAAVVNTLGLVHVRAKKVTLQQVTEDEVVVSKDKLSQAVGPGNVEDVIQFLRGEADPDSHEIQESVQAAASDARRVSDLVMQAVALPQGAAPEEAADKIVVAVRRLYENLAKGSRGQTQKGKKDLIRFLEQLDGLLKDNLAAVVGPESQGAGAMVGQAVEGMMDELRIDSLATEYAKKRNAIDTSERRILRYIKSVGWAVVEKAGLMDRLMSEGFTTEEWDALIEKSGVVVSGAGRDSGS